jgi:multidrug efflux pump subunit AcrA (membrane-fusion protein)
MMITKKTFWIPLVAVTIAVSASACGGAEPDPLAAADAAQVSVTTDAAAMTSMPQTFEAGGALVARQTAVLSSRILAPVVRVNVSPGDRVRRGQVLIEFDSADIAGRAAGASSSLASAQASARAADSERTAAESAVTLARATHDRIARLQKERSATPQELDQAVAALRQAEARLAAITAQVEASRRAVDAADAGSRVATITQSWTTLTAPFDGLVVSRQVDPGTTVGPGQPLLTIEGASDLQMDVRLDASRAAGLTVGQTAEIRVETGGVTDWAPARITEIARVDPSSHSFTVTLEAPTAAGWRSGYFGRARFSGATSERLTVAASAIVTRGQLTFVYLVDAEGRARLRVVSTGESRDGRTEVLAGLSSGDRVVVNPPSTLVDGQKVRS